MNPQLLKRLLEQQGSQDVFSFLTEGLSLADLNSLLLAVYQKRTKALSPAAVLRNYQLNRLVQPVDVDEADLVDFEQKMKQVLPAFGMETVSFGPVAPLGSCSVVGEVDQNNVLTALRQTEVVSDVTNLLALEIAWRKRAGESGDIHLSASHRHLRTQHYEQAGFTAHFRVLSLASAGRDRGGGRFELAAMTLHLEAYQHMLTKGLGLPEEHIRLFIRSQAETDRYGLAASLQERWPGLAWKAWKREDFSYYQGWQIGLSLRIGGEWFEVMDGGWVDWTQQYLQNRKERLLISGIGTEFLYRLMGQG
ncbi:MAG: hypothetical protein AAFR61_02595 [Bacteroidota bacterium]